MLTDRRLSREPLLVPGRWSRAVLLATILEVGSTAMLPLPPLALPPAAQADAAKARVILPKPGEVDQLIEDLGDKRFRTRVAAEKRLLEIGLNDPDAVLKPLEEAMKSRDPEVRNRAGRIHDQVTRQAKGKPKPGEVDQLIKDLGDNSFRVRQAADKRLLEIGMNNPDAVLKPLQEAMKSPDPEVRNRAGRIYDQLNQGAKPKP